VKRIYLLIATIAAAALMTAPDAPAQSRPSGRAEAPEREASPSQAPARAARMEDDFKVLLERSIFARSGAARAATTTSAPTRPSAPPMSPEQTVVFIGVIAQDDEYVAFAENQQTRQLMILRTGDDIARGKVVGITLDTIAYGSGNSIRVVHLGQNLAGEAVTSFASSGSPTTGPAGAQPGTPSAPSTAGMTPAQQAIAERLRQRRERGE
jgi:hypothetical protein